MAVFSLVDEQIVWTDNKLSDSLVEYCEFKTANSANLEANLPQNILLFASSIPPRRKNRPFVRLSPSECEFRSDKFRRTNSFRSTKSSENLFVPFLP